MKHEWIVGSDESGVKLQQFLQSKLPTTWSLKQIKKAIDLNSCTLNGRIERFSSTLVAKGDKIIFDAKDNTTTSFDPARILFEDSSLLAYNKPAGIPFDHEPLLTGLAKHIKAPIHPVHRLDRDTSGVLLFAKSEPVLKQCILLFKSLSVEKEYDALVDGVIKNPKGIIKAPLGVLGEYHGQKKWGVTEDGLTAITRWTKIKAGQTASLVKCYPETGRTHQIRVHLNYLGHPILGDGQYGKRFRCAYTPGRHLLHAAKLSLPHPLTQKPLIIIAPLPTDFKEAMENCL